MSKQRKPLTMHDRTSSLRIGLAGFLICLSFAAWPATLATAGPHDADRTILYVSTNGNDQWSGRLPAPTADRQDGPFATLTAARNAIRRLKSEKKLPGAVDVLVLEGTHHLAEPLVLTAEDAGDENHPVTWSAYPGHHPVLGGGTAITNWKPSEGKIVETQLPDVKAGKWKFRQLFFRGERQVRARWPNPDPADPLYSGWAFIETAASTKQGVPYTHRYTADQPPQSWTHAEQAEMLIFPWYCWVNDLVPVKSASLTEKSISLTRAPPFSMPLMPGNRFRVANMREELDQPGEWCLRTDTGTLYFWPPDELQPGDVVAPVIDTLIELRGTATSFPITTSTIAATSKKTAAACIATPSTASTMSSRTISTTRAWRTPSSATLWYRRCWAALRWPDKTVA